MTGVAVTKPTGVTLDAETTKFTVLPTKCRLTRAEYDRR